YEKFRLPALRCSRGTECRRTRRRDRISGRGDGEVGPERQAKMVYRIASALPTLLLGASLALGQGGTGKQPSPTPTPAASPTPKKTTPAKGTGSTKNATPSSGQGKRAESEIAFWESIKNSTDPEDFKAYLQQYPNGTFATLARNRLKKLEAAGPKPTSTPVPS